MSAAEITPEQALHHVDIGSVALMLGGVVTRGTFSSREEVGAAVEKALDLTEELVQVFDNKFMFEQSDYMQLQDVLIQRYQRVAGFVLPEVVEKSAAVKNKRYNVPI